MMHLTMAEYLEYIWQLNLRHEAAHTADTGLVGVFWIYEGLLFAGALPRTEGVDHGDFVVSTDCHDTRWRQLQQLLPTFKNYEYDQVPRGRVVFSKRDGKFHIYGSEQFVKNEAEKMMVLEGFSIAASEAVFRFDEHYSMAAADRPDDSCDDCGRSI